MPNHVYRIRDAVYKLVFCKTDLMLYDRSFTFFMFRFSMDNDSVRSTVTDERIS